MPTNPTTSIRPPRRGGAQTAAALVRGVLALAVLLSLLAGLPVLLWWATAIVGPPGLAAASSLLSTSDSGQVFLLVLAVAGWAGWACFVCAALLEIPAQLRGRTAPQIRGLAGQRAAAALVSAVLLALPAGTALAAPAPAAVGVSVSAAPVPGAPAAATAATQQTGAPGAAMSHTVQDSRPAESLWSIAEQRLGDGERWGDIAALNEGQTMVDGTRFHADQPIQPGWILHLPTDARPAGPGTGAGPDLPGAAGATHTVREGESLSEIAAATLGSADRYQEIFDLNRGQALPDGTTFTDPDLILPGQQLALPQPAAPAVPSPTPPAPPVPAAPAAPAPTAPATPNTPAAPAPGTPTPAASAPSAPSTAPSTAAPAPVCDIP
ncbi:LysM peptidoglycan-binding domain-containing protein [Streptomyces sp. NPDC051555]|uniref:LysM peptidoglycan-binding domain-containing protein n=1 Tax=Streptomyces sp. NPDC051555 TaxID=3365657 RepID=UPI0037B0B177